MKLKNTKIKTKQFLLALLIPLMALVLPAFVIKEFKNSNESFSDSTPIEQVIEITAGEDSSGDTYDKSREAIYTISPTSGTNITTFEATLYTDSSVLNNNNYSGAEASRSIGLHDYSNEHIFSKTDTGNTEYFGYIMFHKLTFESGTHKVVIENEGLSITGQWVEGSECSLSFTNVKSTNSDFQANNGKISGTINISDDDNMIPPSDTNIVITAAASDTNTKSETITFDSQTDTYHFMINDLSPDTYDLSVKLLDGDLKIIAESSYTDKITIDERGVEDQNITSIDISTSNITDSSVDVNVTNAENINNALNTYIFYSLDSGENWTYSNKSLAGTNTGESKKQEVSFTISNLNSSTDYELIVGMSTSEGSYINSDVDKKTTFATSENPREKEKLKVEYSSEYNNNEITVSLEVLTGMLDETNSVVELYSNDGVLIESKSVDTQIKETPTNDKIVYEVIFSGNYSLTTNYYINLIIVSDSGDNYGNTLTAEDLTPIENAQHDFVISINNSNFPSNPTDPSENNTVKIIILVLIIVSVIISILLALFLILNHKKSKEI